MDSVWSKHNIPSFEKLERNIKTDVLIIGGGIAGLLIAHEFKKRGIECVIVEANRICGGITKNTTAKITSQHGLIYNKLISSFGVDTAKKYLSANENAIVRYREICKDIGCDFEEKDSYVFLQESPTLLQKELNALEKLSYKAEFTSETELPFATLGAIKFKNQAQFNPTKFAAAIAPNLKIFENTNVIEIDGHTAKTNSVSITAERIIVATHFPFINTHGLYFLKMYQSRSYVTAIENNQPINMYVDGGGSGLSFRSYDNLLFIGSGSHRTGKPSRAWEDAKQLAKRYYPNSKIKYQWAAQDCMTLDGIPYIGEYSKVVPYMYVATGFNKWGMTSAMVAADIIADLVCDKENEFADVFTPSRSIFKKQLAVNIIETTANLLRPTAPRCSHLGCALKWNKNEHTWDCSCHGSRFDKCGNLIDNPATKGLK